MILPSKMEIKTAAGRFGVAGRFIAAATDMKGWLEGVKGTHEEDEIRVAVLARLGTVTAARMNMWEFLPDGGIGLDDLKEMFVKSFEWASSECGELFRLFGGRTKLFRTFVEECGLPENASALAIKAETAGDKEIARILEESR